MDIRDEHFEDRFGTGRTQRTSQGAHQLRSAMDAAAEGLESYPLWDAMHVRRIFERVHKVPPKSKI